MGDTNYKKIRTVIGGVQHSLLVPVALLLDDVDKFEANETQKSKVDKKDEHFSDCNDSRGLSAADETAFKSEHLKFSQQSTNIGAKLGSFDSWPESFSSVPLPKVKHSEKNPQSFLSTDYRVAAAIQSATSNEENPVHYDASLDIGVATERHCTPFSALSVFDARTVQKGPRRKHQHLSTVESTPRDLIDPGLDGPSKKRRLSSRSRPSRERIANGGRPDNPNPHDKVNGSTIFRRIAPKTSATPLIDPKTPINRYSSLQTVNPSNWRVAPTGQRRAISPILSRMSPESRSVNVDATVLSEPKPVDRFLANEFPTSFKSAGCVELVPAHQNTYSNFPLDLSCSTALDLTISHSLPHSRARSSHQKDHVTQTLSVECEKITPSRPSDRFVPQQVELESAAVMFLNQTLSSRSATKMIEIPRNMAKNPKSCLSPPQSPDTNQLTADQRNTLTRTMPSFGSLDLSPSKDIQTATDPDTESPYKLCLGEESSSEVTEESVIAPSPTRFCLNADNGALIPSSVIPDILSSDNEDDAIVMNRACVKSSLLLSDIKESEDRKSIVSAQNEGRIHLYSKELPRKTVSGNVSAVSEATLNNDQLQKRIPMQMKKHGLPTLGNRLGAFRAVSISEHTSIAEVDNINENPHAVSGIMKNTMSGRASSDYDTTSLSKLNLKIIKKDTCHRRKLSKYIAHCTPIERGSNPSVIGHEKTTTDSGVQPPLRLSRANEKRIWRLKHGGSGRNQSCSDIQSDTVLFTDKHDKEYVTAESHGEFHTKHVNEDIHKLKPDAKTQISTIHSIAARNKISSDSPMKRNRSPIQPNRLKDDFDSSLSVRTSRPQNKYPSNINENVIDVVKPNIGISSQVIEQDNKPLVKQPMNDELKDIAGEMSVAIPLGGSSKQTFRLIERTEITPSAVRWDEGAHEKRFVKSQALKVRKRRKKARVRLFSQYNQKIMRRKSYQERQNARNQSSTGSVTNAEEPPAQIRSLDTDLLMARGTSWSRARLNKSNRPPIGQVKPINKFELSALPVFLWNRNRRLQPLAMCGNDCGLDLHFSLRQENTADEDSCLDFDRRIHWQLNCRSALDNMEWLSKTTRRHRKRRKLLFTQKKRRGTYVPLRQRVHRHATIESCQEAKTKRSPAVKMQVVPDINVGRPTCIPTIEQLTKPGPPDPSIAYSPSVEKCRSADDRRLATLPSRYANENEKILNPSDGRTCYVRARAKVNRTQLRNTPGRQGLRSFSGKEPAPAGANKVLPGINMSTSAADLVSGKQVLFKGKLDSQSTVASAPKCQTLVEDVRDNNSNALEFLTDSWKRYVENEAADFDCNNNDSFVETTLKIQAIINYSKPSTRVPVVFADDDDSITFSAQSNSSDSDDLIIQPPDDFTFIEQNVKNELTDDLFQETNDIARRRERIEYSAKNCEVLSLSTVVVDERSKDDLHTKDDIAIDSETTAHVPVTPIKYYVDCEGEYSVDQGVDDFQDFINLSCDDSALEQPADAHVVSDTATKTQQINNPKIGRKGIANRKVGARRLLFQGGVQSSAMPHHPCEHNEPVSDETCSSGTALSNHCVDTTTRPRVDEVEARIHRLREKLRSQENVLRNLKNE